MKMDMNRRPLRVLWFAGTPGLSANYLKVSIASGGWISSLQSALGNIGHCQLGFVFYSEEPIAPFEYEGTWYYPVQKLGNSKKKRLLNRLTRRTEYDENLPHFLKAVELFKPDIIHVHGTEFSFGLISRQVSHIPIVVSIQGNLTAYQKKYFSGLNMPGLGKRLLSGYPFFLADYKIWQKRAEIEREILRRTEFVFGRTDWDRRICLALAPGASYYHLDEVIRPRFYGLERKPGVNAAPVFFTTTGPTFYKGFETVLETARILTDNRMAFTWLVAGLKEDYPLVKLMLQSRGVSDLAAINIRLLGTLPEEELASQLTDADAFVQVSHIENSPNSLCEAMLAGIPVIASFAGGTSSLVQDGVQGVLVQDGDPYALAGALQELVRYPERYQPMAAEGRRIALLRHDPGTIVADMVGKYAEIIEVWKKNHQKS